MAMRLVTRSDFDGLACGALLLEAGIIDHWKFAHPKDLQDGLVPIDSNDCLANSFQSTATTVLQTFHLLKVVDFGLIIIPANLSEISLKENTREKAALPLLVHESFMNITVAKKSSLTLMILWLP